MCCRVNKSNAYNAIIFIYGYKQKLTGYKKGHFKSGLIFNK
ncbi:hypothetical protein PESP_a3163 [Pseudoalteromonas espejiana DSM 9414]|nr:hypothetical protein PESP_a3163 [Pseudoalteromonas espejiana DSM 9414]